MTLITCPACHAEMTLDVLLTHEEGRVAAARLLERGLGLGAVAARYVALFRTGKRRMSIERMCALVNELLPDIERQAITRKGRDWPAPPETWRAAMEVVLAKRDKGTLTLPLTGHGLLHEVICAAADKAEAAVEREREEDRRNHRPAGPRDGGMVNAVNVAPVGAAPALVPPPVVPYTGPSKAALALRAQIDAAQRARQAPPSEGVEP